MNCLQVKMAKIHPYHTHSEESDRTKNTCNAITINKIVLTWSIYSALKLTTLKCLIAIRDKYCMMIDYIECRNEYAIYQSQYHASSNPQVYLPTRCGQYCLRSRLHIKSIDIRTDNLGMCYRARVLG